MEQRIADFADYLRNEKKIIGKYGFILCKGFTGILPLYAAVGSQ